MVSCVSLVGGVASRVKQGDSVWVCERMVDALEMSRQVARLA